MKPSHPPRLAVWLLKHFGPEINLEALAGDLQEAFSQGKSERWYWRQVLRAISWRKHLRVLLICVACSWYMFWLDMWRPLPGISLPLNVAIVAIALLMIYHLPGMLRARQRATLVMLTVLFFFWFSNLKELAQPYGVLALIFISNLLFYRKKKPVPSQPNLTWRELVEGDPDAERLRLIENLHLALLQETDPALRTTYEQAISTLQTDPPRDPIQPG